MELIKKSIFVFNKYWVGIVMFINLVILISSFIYFGFFYKPFKN